MSIPAGSWGDSTEARGLTAGRVANPCPSDAPARVLYWHRAPALDGLMPHAFDAAASHTAVAGLMKGAELHCAMTDALDVRVAEWVLDAGARLHVALGIEPDALRQRFAAHADALQAPRLAAVLARCDSIAVAGGLLDHETGWQRDCANVLAAGRAMLAAGRHAIPELVLQPGGRGCELAATGKALDATPPLTTAPVAGRRMAGIVFADFAGFRHVDDGTMPLFWNRLYAAISAALAPLGGSLLLGKTWGDGLHFVTCDAASAAELACTLRETVAQQQAQHPELQALALRIAVHYAPVFVERDPIADSVAYIGSQLTYAARIEPVTPAGAIYTSEACAAQLALGLHPHPPRYQLQGEGIIALAKDHGRARIYRLQRAAA